MKITIHQPEHLIWLGLVKKIHDADVFVILDSVQYKHGDVQNRNKIRTSKGWEWATIPTTKHPLATKIKDVEIFHGADWHRKYLQALKTNYGSAKFFNTYFPEIERIILKKHKLLAELNIELMMFVLSAFGITDKKILKSSDMDLGDAKGGSNVILAICKQLGAKQYISGAGGKNYMKIEDFDAAGINVIFFDFEHPVYQQLHEPFLPYMSSVDLLFHYGPEARGLIGLDK